MIRRTVSIEECEACRFGLVCVARVMMNSLSNIESITWRNGCPKDWEEMKQAVMEDPVLRSRVTA